MKPTKEDIKKAHDHFIEKIGRVPPHLAALTKYNPEALMGFYYERNSTMYDPPEGAFPKKIKEIIITAVECALKIPAKGHARRAIKAGATMKELNEALSMVLWLSGITTYAYYCVPALLAAEDEMTQKKDT